MNYEDHFEFQAQKSGFVDCIIFSHLFQVKCGDFRSLEPAAWHDIHSRFGTHLGPKPGVETLDVQCRVMPTCQKLRIFYELSFDFVANLSDEGWYTLHDIKESYLQYSYQGMRMHVCGFWGPGNRERSRLPIPLEWSKHWMLQGRIESLSSHCFWVCMIVWASSYHSFSLEDGFHDYVIRGDKADDLRIFWEHRIITDYSDLFRLQLPFPLCLVNFRGSSVQRWHQSRLPDQADANYRYHYYHKHDMSNHVDSCHHDMWGTKWPEAVMWASDCAWRKPRKAPQLRCKKNNYMS